ncbi:MAG: GNAT family N-acetyltransferase [Clostridiales bacterium]|nr:GNAT family N-acetyltransferase [Clostridiales bacterium]
MRTWEHATARDADEIMRLYRAAANAGRKTGRSDWDDEYPDAENIAGDLEQRGLYVVREHGRILAAISLVSPEDIDGLGISWTPADAREACRFCLSPELQGRGHGERLFRMALALAKAQGIEAVRYLCAKANPAAFRLYTRMGHRRLEDAVSWGTEFYSFEVLL